MKKTKVVVVGAGLAGLAAAYELTKQKKFDVTLIEVNDYAGGRVHHKAVNGVMVDFGGFIVYPWYKNYHRIMRELGIRRKLRPLPVNKVYYDLQGKGEYRLYDDYNFSKTDMLKIWTKSFWGLILAGGVDEPDLERFDNQTISQYFRKLLGKKGHAGTIETLADTVSQGYCYGPISKNKMAFMAPIIRNTNLQADLDSAWYFQKGNGIMSEYLAKAIKKNGGRIEFKRKMKGISKKTIKTNKGNITADAFVFAQPIDATLFKEILPKIKPKCSYTHFVTATLLFAETPVVNEDKKWGAVFYKPKPRQEYQILSSVNLSTLYGKAVKSHVNVNVVIRNDKVQSLSKQGLARELRADVKKLFPDRKFLKVVEMVHWKKTMPISEESFVQKVRGKQGQGGYFFAGDYLGSPSMETALSTGVHAAKMIKDSLEIK